MKLSVFFMILTTALFCQNIKPVMLYDSRNLNDKGWNESIHKGIKRFENKTKVDVKEDFALNKEEFSIKVEKYSKKGYSPIIFINLYKEQKDVLKKILLKFPKIRFIVLNGEINLPNVQSFLFSYQEASFLAGYLASKKSKTKKIGFIGGMDIPIIKNFLCGYIKGAKYANPKTDVIYEYVSSNPIEAWNSPNIAFDMSINQIKNGVDVLQAAAGASSLGVLKAAHAKNVLGIGVDANQNYLYPANILTSVLVRVDNAVFAALITAYRDIWGDHKKIMGLQEKGVGLAFDKYNKALISKKLRKDLDNVKGDILLNKIKIPDYSINNKCVLNKKVIF